MKFEEDVVSKGLPFRMRLTLAVVAAVVLSAFAAPVALAQSPDDIPGFDQLPLPGGEDPAAEPSEAPGGGDGGGGGGTGPQVDAPGGGVDTGAGGLAGSGAPVALGAAGALAAMGGAVFVARRRIVRG